MFCIFAIPEIVSCQIYFCNLPGLIQNGSWVLRSGSRISHACLALARHLLCDQVGLSLGC